MKKITLATIKSFVKKNSPNLLVKVDSHFDGMTDGTEYLHNSIFKKATQSDWALRNFRMTMGFDQLWFVGQSRDYFKPFETNELIGFEVYNSCKNFFIAVKK